MTILSSLWGSLSKPAHPGVPGHLFTADKLPTHLPVQFSKAPRASACLLSRQFCPLGSFLAPLPIWIPEVGLTAGMMLRLQLPSNQNPFLCGLGPQAALQASSSCTRLTARDDVLLPLVPPLSGATLCSDAVTATATR